MSEQSVASNMFIFCRFWHEKFLIIFLSFSFFQIYNWKVCSLLIRVQLLRNTRDMLSSRVCRAFLCPENLVHAVAKITNTTTVQTNIPEITIIANITNQGSDTGKYNESLKESTDREQGN